MYNTIAVYTASKCKQLRMPWQNKNCYICTITIVCWKPTIFLNSSRAPHRHVSTIMWNLHSTTTITSLVPEAPRRSFNFAKHMIADIDKTFCSCAAFFCINFSASLSIWVHCARWTITHLDIAGLALASDIPMCISIPLTLSYSPFFYSYPFSHSLSFLSLPSFHAM